MAATVIIYRTTGAGPTTTDITSANSRASTSDAPTPGTSDPIPIPPSGTNYSFWISTYLNASTSPTGTINNVKWYTDGGNGFGTGVTCKMNTATAYTQATGTQGSTGDVLNGTNYPSLAGATSDAFTFTSGSPKSVTGSISNPSTGKISDYVVYQIEVGSTAAAGTTPQETFTWRYDET